MTLSAACQLKAGDAFDTVFALLLGEVKEVVDNKNGWKWLTSRNVDVDGNYVIISLGFYADALKQVGLLVAKERFDLTANWDSWSESHELDILKELRHWLINELGREGLFEWGEAQAGYDPKGGFSSISLRYH